jgi:hypothetical protein
MREYWAGGRIRFGLQGSDRTTVELILAGTDPGFNVHEMEAKVLNAVQTDHRFQPGRVHLVIKSAELHFTAQPFVCLEPEIRLLIPTLPILRRDLSRTVDRASTVKNIETIRTHLEKCLPCRKEFIEDEDPQGVRIRTLMEPIETLHARWYMSARRAFPAHPQVNT